MPLTRRSGREVDIRRFRINDYILNKYGYSEDCEGCNRKRNGDPDRRGHTDKCRERLMMELANDDKDRSRIEAQRHRLEPNAKLREDQREDTANKRGKDDEKNEPNAKKQTKNDVDLSDFNEDELKELFADSSPVK